MEYNRRAILAEIDRVLSEMKADHWTEEEIERREANLKDERSLDCLEFILNLLSEKNSRKGPVSDSLLLKASRYPVEAMELPARAYNRMIRYNKKYDIRTAADFLELSIKEIKDFEGIGTKTLAEILAARERFIQKIQNNGEERGPAIHTE